jgi:hypothetical protein
VDSWPTLEACEQDREEYDALQLQRIRDDSSAKWVRTTPCRTQERMGTQQGGR